MKAQNFDAGFMLKLDELREEMTAAMRLGAKWVMQSSQIFDEASPLHGCMKNEYNTRTLEWDFFEPFWHTGQGVLGLLAAHHHLGNPEYLNRSKLAGEYMLKQQILMPCEPELEGLFRVWRKPETDIAQVATFTDGAEALVALYRQTKDDRYLKAFCRGLDWIIDNLYLPELGLIIERFDMINKQPLKIHRADYEPTEEPTRYARPNNEGAPFVLAYQLTGDEKYRRIGDRVAERLLADQNRQGLWMLYMPNDVNEGAAHARFNLWYALALLRQYELSGDTRHLQACCRTADWHAGKQTTDGALYYRTGLDGSHSALKICGSAVAMAGLLWTRLLKHAPCHQYRAAILKGVKFLLDTQHGDQHPNHELQGAFFECWRIEKGYGFSYYWIRDIATHFALQFLGELMDLEDTTGLADIGDHTHVALPVREAHA